MFARWILAADELKTVLDPEATFKAIRESFRPEPKLTDPLVVVLAALILVGIIAHLARKIRPERRPAVEEPRDEFAGALNELKLGWHERHDLRQLARKAGLSYPTSMLLSPANFAHAMSALHPEHDADLRNRLVRTARKLFGNHPLPPIAAPRAPGKPAPIG